MTSSFRATCLLLATGILPGSPFVCAQEVSQQDLQDCAARASAAEKLACYEALTAIPEAAPDPESETALPPVSADKAATPEREIVAPDVTDGGPAAPATASDAARDIPAPVAAGSEAAPAATEIRSTVPQDLGAEHLDRGDGADADDPFPVTAVVDEVTRSRSGRLYFHFSNGQVWRQNAARHFRYPDDEEFEVIISRGFMGDYRLRIGDDGPMTRIQRVE